MLATHKRYYNWGWKFCSILVKRPERSEQGSKRHYPGFASAATARGFELRCGDAQGLDLPDDSFDAVYLLLILQIVPDGRSTTEPSGASQCKSYFAPGDSKPNTTPIM